MASPKSCVDIPYYWGLVKTQQEADQRGFWMSFEDRGPQRRAVSTMTSGAEGGSTLQDVVRAKFQDSIRRGVPGGQLKGSLHL